MNKPFFLCLFLLISICTFGQSYEVQLTPITIDELGGLQSYAIGTYNGEWLLVGGRLDGLHRRQPFASFSADGKNQDLIVVNPTLGKTWRVPLSSLPSNMSEQLSSTNMQFYQSENDLICTGGYAYSPTEGDHITFPYLTIIDLPGTIKSVKENTLSDNTFQQFEHETFRVTGGALNKIDDVYHLVGGHKFMGRYNPMGPDHGPGFIQEYTDEIRRFKVTTGDIYEVELLASYHDAFHLHRRDYNLAPIISEGNKELMIYSGVFQPTSDLPWLYPVKIGKNNYEALEDFTQYFNHYHCAYLPLFNPEEESMHTIFFGGIAQFYEEAGGLVQDNDVPFVNTIAEVQMDKNGVLSESKLETTMPGYLGAGSVFIIDPELPIFKDGIIDASAIGNDFIDAGYIYGGIRSSMPNIFWINTGQESEASQTVYKVTIRKNSSTSSIDKNQAKQYLNFYPNPANNLVRMSIDIDVPMDFSISISNESGQTIYTHNIKKQELTQGRNYILLDNVNIGYGAFNYTVNLGKKKITRKVIWTE